MYDADHHDDQQLSQWLRERSLAQRTALEMGVRCRKGKIEFPYLDYNHDELYRKVRLATGEKRMWCEPSGSEQVLCWGENLLPDPNDGPVEPTAVLVITEGEPDAIAAKQVGQPYVISLPSGTGTTPEACREKAVRCLSWDGKTVKPRIAQFRLVIVAMDCDASGVMMRDAVTEIIGEEYCLWPTYPPSCKDANDVIKDFNNNKLVEVFEASVPVYDDGVVEALKIEREPLRPMSLGVEWVDPLIRFVEPELIVLGGEANIGKSTAGYWLLANFLAEHPQYRCTIFNGEDPSDIVLQNLLRFHNVRARADGINTATEEWQRARDDRINHQYAFVTPKVDESVTLEWILNRMERSALVHKRRVFWLDPWNEIQLPSTPGKSTTDKIGDALVAIKQLARRHRMIVMISHHTTIRRDPYGDSPNKYALADSAHWANKSDHMLIVHQPRPKKDPELRQLISARVRVRGVMGDPCGAYFRYNAANFSLDLAIPRDDDDTGSDDGF